MKKVFACIVIVVISFFNDSLFSMDTRNPLGPSTSNRTYINDIRDNLPLLAQPDAEEFCEKMKHSFTVLFSNDNNSHVKAWGEFFRRIIFQKEMGIRILPYENGDNIVSFSGNIDNKEQSSKLAALFNAVDPDIISSTLDYKPLDIFLKVLNSTLFPTLKEKNSYGLFMDGFLDLIQGIRNNDQQKNESGVYKLVLSAYGLNGLALEVLKKLDIKMLKVIISRTKEIKDKIKRETSAYFMKYAVDHELFLRAHQTPYFMRLSDKNRSHVQLVMSSYFQTFCDVYYEQLKSDKKIFYMDLDKKLRDQLLANRDSVSKMKTVWFIVDTYVFPIIASVVSLYLLFSDLSDINLTKIFQIAGGSIFVIYTIYKVFQAIYTYMFEIHLPTYDEQQIRLSSLLLTYLFILRTSITGNSVGQQFLDYLDDKYDDNKTLSKNALDAFNRGDIK